MRNLFFLSFIALITLSVLNSCDKDDENTVVKVKVYNGGTLSSGITVYMFDANSGPTTSFFSTTYADKSVISDSDGIATFNLQDTFDLDVIDSQTTLYFGVFNSNYEAAGYSGVTIENNQTKTISINY